MGNILTSYYDRPDKYQKRGTVREKREEVGREAHHYRAARKMATIKRGDLDTP